ncbi:MAG TPA: hypothetical protein DCQ64_26580 [Candidatus Rokubacteria bacterium]|nr:hypothetical protein [Candidatus Rokubacteria bacterium]
MPATITRSEGHLYTVNGVPYDGVTSVIGSVIRKPGLEKWIGQLGNAEAERQRDAAASHGTLVHALAALVVEGVPSIPMGGEDAPAQAQLNAFTDWYEEHVGEVYAVELMVAHDGYRYAGALDFLVRFHGDRVPTLVDVKSGKALFPEMRAQTASYREATLPLLRGYGFTKKTCRRGILHVPMDADGPARFYEHKNHQADFQAFLSCLFLYRWLKS